jgi:ankyrin repeat protein
MAHPFDFCNIKNLMNGSEQMLEYIVENREKDFYTKDVKLNMTPLILATLFCRFDVFEYVFNCNPKSINNSDTSKITAILYSIIHGYRDKFDFLLEKGAALTLICEYDNKNPLMIAAEQTDTYFLQKILKLNMFHLNDETCFGNTALLIAVRSGNIEAIKMLLSNSASINYVPKKWKTMNVIKCALDHKGYVKCSNLLSLLIENGAHTINPLIYYSSHKTRKYGSNNVELLLKAGASPNQSNRAGTTPLISAVKNGNFDTVKILVENGADIRANPQKDNSIFELARKLKPSKILEYLTVEDNWRRRRNFVFFLQCFFSYSHESLSSHSRISNIDNIFALYKSNDMLHIIMSYI